MTGILHNRNSLLIIIFLFLIFPFVTNAQVAPPDSGGGAPPDTGSIDSQLGDSVFENPLPGDNVEDVIENIISVLLGVVGIAALVMFIYGGIIWMTAAGSQERVTMGRETLKWATIGLVIVFTSYALVSLILSSFQGSS